MSAQTWQQVINHGDRAGSGIGGGSGSVLYAGVAGGPVFRSADNGVTWTAQTNGLADAFGGILSAKAFVITPTGRVIRGGDNASWNNKVGSPIFYSDDQGATWTEVPLPFASSARNPAGIGVSDLVMHGGAIYFSDLLSEGVWKSADNGVTWTSSGDQLPTAPFVGFAKTYYAVASAGNALLTIQASKGVFRSTDGGATWSQAVSGIPGVVDSPLVGGRSWNGTDVVGAADGTAFAVSDARLYRSRDGGATWTEVGAGIFQSPNPFVPSIIQPSVRKAKLMGDRVYVTTSEANPRFFEGTALGDSWTELPRLENNPSGANILSQSFYAHNGALYFAGDKGIHRLDLSTAVRTNLLPIVTTAPAGPFGVNVGGTLRIAATAAGTAPFTFEWRLKGELIPGQTGADLAFAASSTNESGTLTLVVRNAAGAVTNTVGQVTVAPNGPGAVDYAFRPQGAGRVTALAVGPDGSVHYGGPFSSQLEAYTGVRRTFPDGQVDPSFVTGAVIGTGSGPGLTAGSPRTLLPLGDGSVLVGATGTGDNQRYYRRLLPGGALDASWPWPNEMPGGPWKIVRLADGKFLVASGSLGGIHRLNADGSFDATFQGPASIGRFQRNAVRDLVVLPDGRILIAGAFNDVDGVPRVAIARLLSNGALDRGWVPAALTGGSEINALAVLPDGRILIGGAFLNVGGQARRNLARLNADGSLDASQADLIPATSPAGVVYAFAVQPDGKAWVGGAFYGVAGRNYVMRLNADGAVDTAAPDIGLETSGGGAVNVLQFTADGRLWIGADSASINGQFVGHLFRVFTDISGLTVGYAGLDQTPDLGMPVTLRGTVPGPFTGLQWRFQGQPIGGATGLELPLGNATLAASGAYDLVVTSAGGSYTSAPVNVRVRGPVVIDREPSPVVGILSNSVSFAVSAFGRLPLGYQWLKDGEILANATNRTLALTNLQLTASGDYAVRVSGGDGSTATSEPAFLTVVPAPGSTNAEFRVQLGTANGLRDVSFLPDGRAIVSGGFSNRLALVNLDGTVDPGFKFDPAGLIEVTAVERQPDGKVLVLVRLNTGGGPFAVRRLNADGSVDPAFGDRPLTGFFPSDLKLASDGGILVASQAGIERLNPDGSPDTGFNQRAKLNNGALSCDVDPAGRIYVTGTFTTVAGQARAQLARLLADGTFDPTFAPTNTFSSSWTVTALADGALVGDFNGFYRFTGTGARDTDYGWNSRLAAWDLSPAGQLVGVLPDSLGNGVIRAADGLAGVPFSTMKVPASFAGYSFIRVAPDGAFWLAKGANGTVDSSALLYRLNGTVTPLALLTSPVSQTVNVGTDVTLASSATGTSKVSYQWQRNGQALPGETNATLVIPDAQPANNGDYAVVVSNRSGSQTSRPATLVVLAAPDILAVSGDGELGLGSPLLLTVNARGVAPLTFEWRRNGTPLPAGDTAEFGLRAVKLADAGQYDVVIRNALGAITSAPVAVNVTVRPGSVIGSFPDLNFGQGIKELNLLPDGGFLADGRALNRFGEQAFILPLTTTDLRERIAVDPVLERIYMVDGPKLAFTLTGTQIVEVTRPPINMRLVRLEASGSLLVSDNGITPTLQRVDTNGAVVANFTPALRPVIDAMPQPDGKVVVLSFTQRVFQNNFVYDTIVARLLADGSFDPGFVRSTNTFALGQRAERVRLDRQGRLLVLGAFESFNGQPRSRIARFLADGTLDPSFVPAAINGEVVEMAEQLNGKLVIVGAFTEVGGLPRSLIARLNADGSHDESFNPGTGLTRTIGQNVAFDVKVLPEGEIAVAGTFEFADGLPRKGLALLTGDTADLYFTREPADVELALGGSAELVAAGTGTSAVTYQWFKDGAPLTGEVAPTLAISGATAATAGDYRVVIRNLAGELASRICRVAVLVPPTIVRQPATSVAGPADTVTFSVEAKGLHLEYQWRHEGTNLPAANGDRLELSALSPAQAGRYVVVVSNPAGSVTSAEVRLRLRPTLASGQAPTNGLTARFRFEGDFTEAAGRYQTFANGSPGLAEGVEGQQALSVLSGTHWLRLGRAADSLVQASGYSIGFWVRPEGTGSFNVFSLAVPYLGLFREQFLVLGGDDNAVLGNRVFLGTRGFKSVHSTDDRAYVPNLAGRWTHFTVTWNGGDPGKAASFGVYVDGESIPLTDSANNVGGSAASGSGIGRYSDGTFGPSAQFRVDDFQVFNRVITAAEAAELHQPTPLEPKPTLDRQPVGGMAAPGGGFEFSVGASGANLFYEWYRGEMLLPEADGPTLTLSNVTAADAGDYRVVISNSGGSTNSMSATLTVEAVTDPFVDWAAAAGLSGANAAPEADPDADGFSNLAEFVFGSSPTAPDQRPRFIVGSITLNGEEFPTVTYLRRPDAGTARVVVRSSNSLVFPADSTALGVGLSQSGDLEAVTVRSGTPVTGSPRQFFQLQVEP